MKLTVLGKYGPYGKAGGGAASGYLVESGGDKILLDMGSGVMSRLISVIDPKALKYIFISHLHYDHTSDLLPYRYLLEEINHSVTVFTYKEESEWYKLLFDHPNFNIVNIDENSCVNAGNIKLTFAKMKHTCTDYAVKLQSDRTLCYTGDTVYNDNIARCFDGSDAVLADCSKPSGFKGPHMTVDDAKALYEKYKVKIIATHQSTNFDPAEELKNFPKIISAEEMTTYEI